MYESKGLSFTLGRSSKNDFVVEDTPQNQTVSGHHAVIYEKCYYRTEPRPGEAPVEVRFFLYDDSTNGTYVNGTYVHKSEVEIHAGDRITLGKHYVLPVNDFLSHYFSGSKTKQKQQGGTMREGQVIAQQQESHEINVVNAPVFIQGAPAQSGSQKGTGTVIRSHTSYMGLAIVSAFFSLLFGIIAIVYASKSNRLYDSAMATSDQTARSLLYADSEKAGSTAKSWAISGIILGAIGIVISLVNL